MTTDDLIKIKYPNGFSFLEILNNEFISDLLPKNYLPDFTFSEDSNVFMNQYGKFWDKHGYLYESFFLYVKPTGKIAFDPDVCLLQVDRKLDGFLAKISLPKAYRVPQRMELDYFIDLNNVNYEIQSSRITDKKEGLILSSEIMQFGIIDPKTYPDIEFDEMLTDFVNKREELANLIRI